MDRAEYEALVEELMNSETEEARKFEIGNMLRSDKEEFVNYIENTKNEIAGLNERNQQLQVANSQLYRQQSTVVDDEPKTEEDEEINSENITINDL